MTEILNQREERDWAYFGRITLQREKRLRDPNDVLREADRIRAQQRQQKRRRKSQQKQKPITPRKPKRD